MVATFNKLREDFAQLATNMSRESLREFVRHHVGEHSQSDYKQDWPVFVELARDLIAIASSGGGAIIVGVAEANGMFEMK